jgi:uncharacterized membrane protein
MAVYTLAIVAVVLSSMLGALGSLMFKYGSKNISLRLSGLITNYYLILGLMSAGIGAVLFIAALRFGDLSIMYPIISLQYVWISLLSIRFLNEKMNSMKWLGIILIMVGVVAANWR